MEGNLITALESCSNLVCQSMATLVVRLPHLALAWFLQHQTGWKHFLKAQYADRTFEGLYKWNRFDAALLIPYFAVMIILAIYGQMCGWALARAHARSGDAIAIGSYLGSGDTFDRALTRFAVSYADQNERDHQQLVDQIASGELAAESGI